MMTAAVVLRPWETAIFALICSYLRSRFDTSGSHAELTLRFVFAVKIEAVVPATRADEVIQTITAAAQTGKIGDGKIFVYDVTGAVRIRNGRAGRRRDLTYGVEDMSGSSAMTAA
jgi:hypothetical protein